MPKLLIDFGVEETLANSFTMRAGIISLIGYGLMPLML